MSESEGSSDRAMDLGLYRQMRLIRRFEEEALRLMSEPEREIDGPVHPYVGQEAVAVGVCAHLSATDKIISTHRGHGHSIAKGARVDRMMAELFGKVTGYCRGKGGSMHIADFDIGMLGANGIVAAGLPIAAGAALADKLKGTSNVTVCMFGDGAAAAGPFHESLNIAALSALPLVFVCENNGWSVNTTPDVSLATSVIDLAAAYGVAGRVVDGNDVEAVRAAGAWAVRRAREGQGPSMIEARTFRRLVHVARGPMAPDARDADLLHEWSSRDPIDAFAAVLRSRWPAVGSEITSADLSVEEELADAVAFARSSPLPSLETIFEDVFA
jgi:TPP-dependent pyruvate/acetoin dehydrogenase alpha subunit